jgi:hypothetical protein
MTQIVAALVNNDPLRCVARCDKPNFDSLTVTKCNHVFCKVDLDQWFKQKAITHCPDCRDENQPIKQNECIPFTAFLERIIYYAKHEPKTLEEKLISEKVNRVGTYKLKLESRTKSEEACCSICTAFPLPQLYFIMNDENPAQVGRYMHDGCWETGSKTATYLDLSMHEVAKVGRQLPEPPKPPPPAPPKPTSPLKLFFFLIILPMSVWALGMNSRLYRNKNSFLFVLSLPALLTFKVLSLIFLGIKKVLTDKKN